MMRTQLLLVSVVAVVAAGCFQSVNEGGDGGNSDSGSGGGSSGGSGGGSLGGGVGGSGGSGGGNAGGGVGGSGGTGGAGGGSSGGGVGGSGGGSAVCAHPPATTCQTVFDCNASQNGCQDHCCGPCPAYAPVNCPYPKILTSGGINPTTGCPAPPNCLQPADGGSPICPALYAPECGTNGATYGNSCELNVAQATLLHHGVCLKNETVSCHSPAATACGTDGSMYCRDTCPLGALCFAFIGSCTKVGVCVEDRDCWAGKSPPVGMLCNPGQTFYGKCIDHACVPACK